MIFYLLKTLTLKFNCFSFYNSTSHNDKITIINSTLDFSSFLIIIRTCFNVFLTTTSLKKVNFSIIITHKLKTHLF